MGLELSIHIYLKHCHVTFQLRKLKERSKTEVNPRRTGAGEQSSSRLMNKRRSLWCEGSAVENKVEKGDKEKGFDFEEMVAQVKRSARRTLPGRLSWARI